MANGFDSYTPLTQATLDAAKKAGYTFAIRYYATNTSLDKVMTRDEAQRISDNGLYVVSVFQDFNNDYKYFNTSYGTADGKAAYNYAKNTIKQPSGTPIYFAVDYDAEDSEVKGGILDYFTAIKQVFTNLGGEYKIGVYGSGAVCQYIKDTKNLAQFSWLSMSTGWRGYQSYLDGKTWNLRQIKSITINGVSCDSDESSSLGGGGWKL